MNTDSIDKATSAFRKIYDRYLKGSDTKVYFSVIFDKNYYMAKKGSVLSMDYDAFLMFHLLTGFQILKFPEEFHLLISQPFHFLFLMTF